MPPKRPSRAVTPPSTKKKAKTKAQPSIDAFFSSPKKDRPKATTNGHASSAKQGEVISIDDSDEEIQVVSRPPSPAKKVPSPKKEQVEEDEALAKRLAAEWNAGTEQVDKGKGKAVEFGEWEIEDGTGASSSKRSISPGKSNDGVTEGEDAAPTERATSIKRSPSLSPVHIEPIPETRQTNQAASPGKAKAVHPMFAPKPAPSPKTEPGSTVKRERAASPIDMKPFDNKPAITSTSAEAVEPIDFDTDAFLFRPSIIDVSAWPKGRLPYSVLVGVYVQVSSTRSRLTIVRVLTNFLHLLLHASPVDLTPTLYLLSNHLLPSYLPCELGIGSQILSKSIQEVSGVQPRDLKKLWEKWGDPGDIAFEAKSNLRTLVTPAPLLVGDVYKRMLGLSKVKGSQSGKVKGDVVRKLMVQARGEEVRFLVRSLVGNLRIGAVRLTLLTALARATALFHCPQDLLSSVRPILPPPPKAEKGQKRIPRPKVEPDPAREEVEERLVAATKLVRKVYVRHPNYGDLAQAIKDGGLEGLEERVPGSVGIPLSPMLGSITRSLEEVFTRLGQLPFTAEAKLDGQRVQIHARIEGPEGEDDGGGRWVQGDDGTRVWVRLFSRHLEDMTEKYPDILALVHTLLCQPLPPSSTAYFPTNTSTPNEKAIDLLRTGKITSFIMDAEVVAVDKDTGAYRTFQDLSNRAKKDVRVEDIKVVVGIFAFDLMLLNDQTLLDAPFSHRRHILRTLFPPYADTSDVTKARFAHVESLDSTSCEDARAEMQVFFQSVVEQKCEGLMVKLLESGEGLEGEDAEDDDDAGAGEAKGKSKKVKAESAAPDVTAESNGNGIAQAKTGGKKKPLPATYEPDQRSQGWLKVKKDYLEGLGDSLDLVPIGAWWGQGRKAGWWSPILLACHNPETGALEAVCKCISGFTDAFYKDLLVRFPPHNEVPEKCNKDTPLGYYETNGLRPDVWFEPCEVWEIRGADITLSPVYPAAASLLGSERGLSMRFPRFMKRRDDKTWEQASTSEQFADMYRRQIQEAPKRPAAPAAASVAGGDARQGEAEIGGGPGSPGERDEEDGDNDSVDAEEEYEEEES